MNKPRNKWFIISNIVFPLAVGLALYILLRPDAFVSKLMYNLFGIIPRNVMTNQWANGLLIQIFRNHLADLLWAYALTISLLSLGKHTAIPERALFAICVFVAFLVELSQVINPFFTFDIIDLVIELIGVVAAWLIYKRHDNTRATPHNSKEFSGRCPKE